MQDIFASITEQLVSFRATEIAVIGGRGFLAMLVVSLAASLFISALYLIFYQNRATRQPNQSRVPFVGNCHYDPFRQHPIFAAFVPWATWRTVNRAISDAD